MQRLFYQREWHGVDVFGLQAAPAEMGLPTRDFYRTFYHRLLSGSQNLSSQWLAEKQRVGQWLMTEFVERLGSPASLRILSIGAGLGAVERTLWERGCHVDVLECEDNSLRYLLAHEPRAVGILGDARCLPCRAEHYDLVYLSTVDYCFDRDGYAQVLAEIRRVLRSTGRGVCICTSNLALTDLVRGAVRGPGQSHIAGRPGAIPWGYLRTVGEHLRLGRKAGLECDGIYLFDPHFRLRAMRVPGSWSFSWPTLRGAIVAVAFRLPGTCA